MGKIPQQLLLQVILIMLNAFFAMTEIAVISLNANKLRKMAEDGDRMAPRLLKLVEEPSGFLSTIQIGITLAGFLGSAFAAENFSDYLVAWLYDGLGFRLLPENVLDTLAVIVVTLILSYFTLVFGELVPKRIAMQKSMQVARIACGVVSTLAVVMKPIIWFLSASTNAMLKLLGLKTEAEEEAVTEEEIRMMVEMGEEKGAINKEEGQWIDNVFDFGDTMARDAMTHVTDVVAFSVNATDDEVLRTIQSSGLSRFPVYGKDINDVLGILNARQFLLSRAGHGQQTLRELLRPAYFVPETVSANVLFKDMQSKKIHLAVVVDEYGETGGIVTIEDLLEEIVGNIYDEFDPAEPAEIQQLDENRWRISGSAPVEDVAEALDIEIPDDVEYDTLGGMVFSCLHTIPKDGTQLDVETMGLHIHVDRIQERRIEEATVWKLEPPAPEEDEEPRD